MTYSVFRPALGFGLALLVLTFTVRLCFSLLMLSVINSDLRLSQILFWGLRQDLQVIGAFCFFLVVVTTIFAHGRTMYCWSRSIRILIVVLIPTAVILELTSPGLISNLGLCPKPVFSMVTPNQCTESAGPPLSNWLAFALTLNLTLLMIFIASTATKQWVKDAQWKNYDWILAAIILGLCFAAARGTHDNSGIVQTSHLAAVSKDSE